MGTVSKTDVLNKKHYSPLYIFNIIVTLALMFGFGLIPPFATLTPVGMKVLGVFLGVVYGYSTCDVVWPSLFAILAYGLSGYTTMTEAITSMMGHNVVFQSIVCFIAAGALTYYGFGKWFIRWSLTRKIFQGKPLLYVWAFITLFGLSAVVINQIPLAILLYAIWLDIADTCGYPSDSSFRYVGMGGILLGTILGGGMIPYQSWMLGLANTWVEVTGQPLNFGLMGVMTGICTVLILTLYVLASKYVFHVDYSIMEKFDVEKLGEESRHLRPRSKRIIIVYLFTVIAVILGSTLGNTSFGSFINNTLTAAGVFCLGAAILLVLPSGEGDGKPCIVFSDVKETAISWQVIFMCAVTLPVASAVTSDATGIVPWLSGVFSPIFEGKSPLFILVFTIILSIILTNLGSNIAFGAAMIPIIAPFVIQSGMNAQFAGAALIFVIGIGMVLPGASAHASIFHSQEALPNGGMRMKVTLFGCACVLVVTIPVFALFYMILG